MRARNTNNTDELTSLVKDLRRLANRLTELECKYYDSDDSSSCSSCDSPDRRFVTPKNRRHRGPYNKGNATIMGIKPLIIDIDSSQPSDSPESPAFGDQSRRYKTLRYSESYKQFSRKLRAQRRRRLAKLNINRRGPANKGSNATTMGKPQNTMDSPPKRVNWRPKQSLEKQKGRADN
jgi:hypothetical protein